MATLVADEKDPYQIRKLHQQLLDEKRISPEEHKVLVDALSRYFDAISTAMIDID